jgi:dGTPase
MVVFAQSTKRLRLKMTMDWARLLNTSLLDDEGRAEAEDRPNYVQDYDRIVFSAPFRRLANKTQVHPMYAHDHLHHRLIHSIETSSVGRSLGLRVGSWLEAQQHVDKGTKHTIAGILQAACAAHDIGNPPFGHSGEAAIGEWFGRRFKTPTGLFSDILDTRRGEFEAFEGNAQGFRLLTRTEMYRNDGGMRMTFATLGAFTKYPVLAQPQQLEKKTYKERDLPVYAGLKKFGLFASEYDMFAEVAEKTGLIAAQTSSGDVYWKRHPLVFLVEAADDICYNIMDLEDAYIAGDLSFDVVKELLETLIAKRNSGSSGKSSSRERSPSETVATLRAMCIGFAVEACTNAFIEHYDAIMDGTFTHSLTAVSSLSAQFEAIENTAAEQIFTAPRKTKLEVSGRNILHAILDGMLPVYEELQCEGWDKTKLSEYHRQLVASVELDLRDAKDAYTALHSLCDFVSGMTDRYAAQVHKLLSGALD